MKHPLLRTETKPYRTKPCISISLAPPFETLPHLGALPRTTMA